MIDGLNTQLRLLRRGRWPASGLISTSLASSLALMAPAIAWAQEASSSRPSLLEQLLPFIVIIGIFFFLVIRPQQRRAQTHKDFLSNLKRGDSVLTTGGILGTIEGLTDQFVILEIADDVKVRVLKTQIASGIGEELVKK